MGHRQVGITCKDFATLQVGASFTGVSCLGYATDMNEDIHWRFGRRTWHSLWRDEFASGTIVMTALMDMGMAPLVLWD